MTVNFHQSWFHTQCFPSNLMWFWHKLCTNIEKTWSIVYYDANLLSTIRQAKLFTTSA